MTAKVVSRWNNPVATSVFNGCRTVRIYRNTPFPPCANDPPPLVLEIKSKTHTHWSDPPPPHQRILYKSLTTSLFKLLLFTFIIYWVTRHTLFVHVSRGRSPGRADHVSAGPVVSNSQPLSGRTLGLACGGAAQWYHSVKAKYNKYSGDLQINV